MSKSILKGNISIFNRVSFLEKLLFTKHLSIMLKSGIPISEAISTIEEQTASPAFKNVLQGLVKEIQNGQSLATALTKYPKTFDALYINLIKIGEESGSLETNLEYLAGQLKKDYDFKKKVQGAMLYPLIIFVATGLVGGFTSLFVLPKLVDLFASLNVKLPLSTQILIFFALAMKNYGIFIIAGVIGLIFGLTALLRQPKIKPHYHRFLLSLPILGIYLQNIELTSFCRNLGLMLKSGLPINQALETQANATSNLVYKSYTEKLKIAIDKGKNMESELSAPSYKYIPKIMAKMIGVGEKTGKLEDSLLYLGDFFEDEVDSTTKNLANILEPILLLGIGLVVGFVAISIISPIYELTGSVKK